MGASVILAVTSAILVACGSADPPADSGDTSPPPSDATNSSRATEELVDVFGSDVTLREDGSFGLDRWIRINPGPEGPTGRAIRVLYPEGSVSPSASREYGAPGGGMQHYLPITGKPVDAAYMRYWVRFPDDFAFVKGGKLPGLYGGSEVSGGEEPDGSNGFSTRLMWRAGGAGEVYLYAPGESGTSLGRGSWIWPRGDWTCVEQHVELNNPDEDDGSVTVWLNGNEVYAERGIRYRTVDHLRIEGIFFSTFFGGADPSWAPSKDEHADFASFGLSNRRLGCAGD